MRSYRTKAAGGSCHRQVEKVQATVSLANDAVKHAVLLDANGQLVREVELRPEAGRTSVALPAETMYLILRKG